MNTERTLIWSRSAQVDFECTFKVNIVTTAAAESGSLVELLLKIREGGEALED